MVAAWLVTLPVSACIGVLSYALADGIGGLAGVAALFAIAVAGSVALYIRSRRTAVNPDNVNAAWSGVVASDENEDHPDVMAA
jgi:PiT family inorganic phosphate transporter